MSNARTAITLMFVAALVQAQTLPAGARSSNRTAPAGAVRVRRGNLALLAWL